ncbi:Hsp20/alpha crystallin family protein [Chloroflexota bacterium]
MNLIVRRNGGQEALGPFYRPSSLFEDIDTLTRGLRDSWQPFEVDDKLLPQTDMYEENGSIVLKTELPGVNKEDLDITLEGDRLTIKAEKKEESVEDATHHTRERHYGHYFRSVTLPYPVKEDDISATMENGVLKIELPKAEEVRAKRIEIKAQIPKGKRKTKKEK